MSDIQESYSGTEKPPEHLRLDEASLGAFLAEKLPGFGPIQSIEKFKGGQSNPTYRLHTADRDYVLRRKPPGKLIRGAHAIDREYRVVGAVHGEGFPVPRPWLYCDDESVIGSEFYIVDLVEGRIYWDPLMPGESADSRRAMYRNANYWLARLHSLDPESIGLGDFGKPDGYAARNLALWSNQYRAAEIERVDDMHWLMDVLAEHVPTDAPTRLIHGDYGIYNLIYPAGSTQVGAILDWEMATLGDPYVDFAHHLRPWWVQPAEGSANPTLVGQDLVSFGIPTMEQHLQDYCEQMGLERIPDWNWYLAYAQFRFAAMVQGVLKRYHDGTAANKKSTHTPDTVRQAAQNARQTLAG